MSESNKPNKLGIIILNWNGKNDTLDCLDSLYKSILNDQNFSSQIYVVDNGSTDSSVLAFKKKYPDFIYIETGKNLGYAGGNNVGLKKALQDKMDYVCLLNNDTTVGKFSLRQLLKHVQAKGYGLASPKIYFYPGREFHSNSYTPSERGSVIWYAGGRIDWPNVITQHIGVDEVDHGQWDEIQETEFATGCCLLISKQVIEKIGYLDEGYIAYFEDTDFCLRALKAGFKIGYIPQSVVWHKNAGSSGGSGSARQSKLVSDSRFKFAMRYAPVRAKLALIKQKLRLKHT